MASSMLDPFSATGTKTKQAQDAKDMQQLVFERARRTGSSIPPYDFLELIGKGAFGRVYKCKHKDSREIVAVKIIDVDDTDYKEQTKLKDEAITDFIKEVNTLKHLKDSKAKNINYIQEAFDLHSQLWIVTDYCSGGSVHTLMKAYDSGLEERFIIPIAREVALALKYVHDAGVIHRDVKCGNVLISENGDIQVCDFGIAAVMDHEVSKRSTIIGTPYWMAPEMHSELAVEGYGNEIDCWAYGCTIYEMATGMPPYHKFHPSFLRTVLKAAPRLEEDKHSQGLCDFVAFCLQENPESRPTAAQITRHPYIHRSEDIYPTSSLRQMVERYFQWEKKGGQRMSLFNPMGAAAPQPGGAAELNDHDDWIFSTTDRFSQAFDQYYDRSGIAAMDFASAAPGTLPAEIDLPAGPVKELTPFEAAKEDVRAKRGEKYMERLFDQEKAPYDYDATVLEDQEQPLSDLPLRNLSSDRAANRETTIDLDVSGLDIQPSFTFDFSDIPTLRANRRGSNAAHSDEDNVLDDNNSFAVDDRRATKDWKFPSLTMPAQDLAKRATMEWTFADAAPLTEPEAETEPAFPTLLSNQSRPAQAPAFRPTLTRTATEPIGHFNDFLHPPAGSLDGTNPTVNIRDSTPMIDLDFGTGDFQPSFEFESPAGTLSLEPRPISLASISNSLSSIGPFDLEQDPMRREDDLRRFSHRRQQPSDLSLLTPDGSNSPAYHLRDVSIGSIARRNRSRGISVSSSASSFADTETTANTSILERAPMNRNYSASLGKKMQNQFMSSRQASFSRPNGAYSSFSSIGDNGYEQDSDQSMNEHFSRDIGSQMRSHSAMGSFDSAPGGYDTESSAYGSLSIPHIQREEVLSPSFQYDSEGSIIAPRSSISKLRTEGFPSFGPPDPSTLFDGADPEILMQEMERLFAELEQGLAYTADMLQQREDQMNVEMESDTDVYNNGATSEEDGNGESFA